MVLKSSSASKRSAIAGTGLLERQLAETSNAGQARQDFAVGVGGERIFIGQSVQNIAEQGQIFAAGMFQAEQQMIDRAELVGRHDDDRQFRDPGEIGEGVARQERHHQSAGAFD